MTNRWSALSLAVGLATTASAAPQKLPSLTVGSDTFTDLTILGFNATDLYFTHTRGIANVKLRLLSPDLQKEFSYDPVAAAAAEQAQAESMARYTAALAESLAAEARRNAPAARAARAWAELGLADPLGEKSLLHQPAPEVTAEKWLGAKPDGKGRLTLVLFWASWSGAARSVLPQWNAWHKAHADKLLLIALSPETERELAQAGDPQPQFPSGSDPKAKLAVACGATTLPWCVLIDPQGYVRYQGHPAALDDKKLEAIFARVAE